jgi:hypothetical protein
LVANFASPFPLKAFDKRRTDRLTTLKEEMRIKTCIVIKSLKQYREIARPLESYIARSEKL